MGPLAGIRVVDLSQIVSGPLAACILADQGAEVVETPGGDPVRRFGPAKGDLGATFIAVNRGKRGLALDLKHADGKAVLAALIARADVLIENFRPGALDRLGFSEARCRALNPRLIYASVTGFGRDGPYANIRVYDPVIQAVSGMAATHAGADGKAALVGSLVADKVAGLTAAQAITAALFHRERTGEAQRVEVSMLDAALAFNWPDGMYNHSFLDDPPPPFPPYGSMGAVAAAADGAVIASALQDGEFVALMRAVGLDDCAADPRLATHRGRLAYPEWRPRLAAALAAQSLDELMAGFIREGAVGGRVNALHEVASDPQVRHNASLADIDHGPAGRVRVARAPARFAATPARDPAPAPRLGEHSAAILAELGHDAKAVAALFASGAVVAP